MTVKRVAGDVKGDVIGQFNRQVFLLLGHYTAIIAVDHGNRCTPIPLTGQAPIAQSELGDAHTYTIGFTEIHGLVDGVCTIGRGIPCKRRQPVHHIGLVWNEGFGQFRISVRRWQECRNDRKFVFLGEIKITLIVRGAAKDRASAVIHHDKVGDIDGQFPRIVERMTHAQASVKAHFRGLVQGFSCRATFAAFSVERGQFCVFRLKFFGKRMIRRNANK